MGKLINKLMLIYIYRHTSGTCAGVQRQAGGHSPQDLLLGLWPFFLLITLLLSLRQAKLKRKKSSTGYKLDFIAADIVEVLLVYLFGGVCWLGEDGLPVRPYKHDEGEVEKDQVDN